MKTLIGASVVLTCNKHFEVIKDGGILFEGERILKVGNFNALKKDAKISEFYSSCVLLPALINPHIHFEFSGNYGILEFGNFQSWLDSVMKNRDKLMEGLDSHLNAAIKETLKSGIGCVGAISSNGLDLEALSNSPLKVMFFNEIMGTNESKIDEIWDFFKARFRKSALLQSERFKPAIALHSPYSLHSELANRALDLAFKNNLLTQAHFLESRDELRWLTKQNGAFREFFAKFFNNKTAKPFYNIHSFIELFSNIDCYFVHCLYVDNDTLEAMRRIRCEIISAPRSNRLLNNKYFDFFSAQNFRFPLIISTDGRSSNYSLNLLDEARTALFGYSGFNIHTLAKEIILAMSANPARKMRFNNGILEKNRASDFGIFEIPNIANSPQIPLDFLLYATKVKDLFINGKRIEI